MNELLRVILDETMLLSEPLQSFDYERYEQLVELRESLTNLIVSDNFISSENKEIIKRICSYDSMIMAKMQQLKDEANQGIQRINSSKRQKNAYDNSHSNEGFMFDKRN